MEDHSKVISVQDKIKVDEVDRSVTKRMRFFFKNSVKVNK
jgi:hypothetical protein